MSWQAIFLIIGILGLLGCATTVSAPETVTYTQEERRVAMEYALTQNLVLQALIDECQPINDRARVHAQQIQQQWWQRNWPMVAAADAEINTQTQQQQLRLGDITGQLLLIRFIYQAEQRFVQIKRDINKSTNGENTCEIYLEPYANGKQDLKSSEYGPVLTFMSLAANPQVTASSPHNVPQVINGFKAEYNIGRSLYQVEAMVRKTLCPVPEILNIFNRWPREMYGAYCSDKDPSLIVCDWAECSVISGQ